MLAVRILIANIAKEIMKFGELSMNNEYGNMSLYELLNTESNQLQTGASEEMISKFEIEHNMTLPCEYKELLKYSNGASLFSGDVILFSLSNDKNAFKTIDDKLLVIGKYNFGDLLCINLETETVVQWSIENNNIFIEHFNIKEWIIFSIEEMEFV